MPTATMMPAMAHPNDPVAHGHDARTGVDFDRLFRDESPGVFRTLYAFAGGRRDIAEEATAEAFARAIASTRTLREPLAWIYRVGFRIASVELQRDRTRGELTEEGAEDATDTGELIAALRKLSRNQRAAIVLRYEAGLDVGVIAKRMGIAAPTVRVHIHRGRARLRELLGTEEMN